MVQVKNPDTAPNFFGRFDGNKLDSDQAGARYVFRLGRWWSFEWLWNIETSDPCETGAPSEINDTTETGDTIEPSDTNLKIYDIYYTIYDSYTSKTSET